MPDYWRYILLRPVEQHSQYQANRFIYSITICRIKSNMYSRMKFQYKNCILEDSIIFIRDSILFSVSIKYSDYESCGQFFWEQLCYFRKQCWRVCHLVSCKFELNISQRFIKAICSCFDKHLSPLFSKFPNENSIEFR